jgi:hypothetical protein
MFVRKLSPARAVWEIRSGSVRPKAARLSHATIPGSGQVVYRGNPDGNATVVNRFGDSGRWQSPQRR